MGRCSTFAGLRTWAPCRLLVGRWLADMTCQTASRVSNPSCLTIRKPGMYFNGSTRGFASLVSLQTFDRRSTSFKTLLRWWSKIEVQSGLVLDFLHRRGLWYGMARDQSSGRVHHQHQGPGVEFHPGQGPIQPRSTQLAPRRTAEAGESCSLFSQTSFRGHLGLVRGSRLIV